MQAIPIIIPTERRRDCIVQNGKTYCEETDVTGKELGAVLLIVALIAGYTIGALWLAVERDSGLVLVVSLMAPLVIGGLFLYFS